MTIVKICGVRDAETAVEAAKAGADIIGLNFVTESKRLVTPQECHDIVEALRAHRRQAEPVAPDGPEVGEVRGLGWFVAWAEAIADAAWRTRPLIAGVFADQSVSDVNEIAAA